MIFSYRLCDFPLIFLTLALVTLLMELWVMWSPLFGKCRLWKDCVHSGTGMRKLSLVHLLMDWSCSSRYFASLTSCSQKLESTLEIINPTFQSKSTVNAMMAYNTSSVWADRRAAGLLKSSYSPHSMLAHTI